MVAKKNFQIVQLFFAKKDAFAPDGGRKVTVREMKELSAAERCELANLAVKELPEVEMEIAS